jgi:predicted lipase
MHHSQQDQKNRVSQRKIQVFTISHSQETPAVATTVKAFGGKLPPKSCEARRTEDSVRQTSRLGNHQGTLPRFFTQVQDLS